MGAGLLGRRLQRGGRLFDPHQRPPASDRALQATGSAEATVEHRLRRGRRLASRRAEPRCSTIPAPSLAVSATPRCPPEWPVTSSSGTARSIDSTCPTALPTWEPPLAIAS